MNLTLTPEANELIPTHSNEEEINREVIQIERPTESNPLHI